MATEKEISSHKEPLFFKDYYYTRRYSCSFKRLAGEAVRDGMQVLEGGCGKRSVISECRLKTRRTVGIEMLHEDLLQNSDIDSKVVGNLENLPFRDGQFDIIVCRNVVEHLSRPQLVFKEFGRVLRDGGLLILRTPNIFNPLMFLSAILPLGIRSWLKKNIFHDEEGDTFPTYYRCNSKFKMVRKLKMMDMELKYSTYDGITAYFAFSRILLTLATLYEKITDAKWLRWLKTTIIISFQKTEPENAELNG